MASKEQLLAEIEDVLRTMPARGMFGCGALETVAWVGRAVAAIQRWNLAYMVASNQAAKLLRSLYVDEIGEGYADLEALLTQARADLRMEVGPLSVIVQPGQVFDYFDELRKVIEPARVEVFFVDPYIDTEFVGRYLPHVPPGVEVRLLGRKGMLALISAVDAFGHQSGLKISVRSSNALHDRFLFVDRNACYLSGASFKDGGKKSPATLTQIADAFKPMWDAYEALWAAGKVER